MSLLRMEGTPIDHGITVEGMGTIVPTTAHCIGTSTIAPTIVLHLDIIGTTLGMEEGGTTTGGTAIRHYPISILEVG